MNTVVINNLLKLDYKNNEAYKILRSNVQFSGSDLKVIGVTSCMPNEGKSSVSFNLAISLAETGKKVVFVDGDLRKSVVIGRYKINKALIGLTHFLSGFESEEGVVKKTNIKNLYMVFSGPVPPNPSELLSGERFAFLIKELREEYDYIIIDTPPLGSVIDAAVIAKSCDGIILVFESHLVSYKLAQRVKMQIEISGCKILGTVLNKVNINKKRYYGKYYGKYME